MLLLKQTKTYLKDSKKINISDKHFTKLVNFLSLLSNSEPLPEEAKDHPLIGNWSGYREFHVSGDLLVIYQLTADEVVLIRIGTHSQLFD